MRASAPASFWLSAAISAAAAAVRSMWKVTAEAAADQHLHFIEEW
jgi:hypothetical protein